MKLLLIGDVVGKPGRAALLDRLQDLKEQHAIDFTVMNAENVAGGFSITAAIADLLFSSGIDVMTSGNHIFDKHEVVEYISKQPRLLRPANYPPQTPGNTMWTGKVKGVGIAVPRPAISQIRLLIPGRGLRGACHQRSVGNLVFISGA